MLLSPIASTILSTLRMMIVMAFVRNSPVEHIRYSGRKDNLENNQRRNLKEMEQQFLQPVDCSTKRTEHKDLE